MVEKVKEYLQNYLGHILKMSSRRIPRKLFNCRSKSGRD
jgi:hypothetical protein